VPSLSYAGRMRPSLLWTFDMYRCSSAAHFASAICDLAYIGCLACCSLRKLSFLKRDMPTHWLYLGCCTLRWKIILLVGEDTLYPLPLPHCFSAKHLPLAHRWSLSRAYWLVWATATNKRMGYRRALCLVPLEDAYAPHAL